MEYDNNHIIIASRAYYLQSPTCTRVNNLVNKLALNTNGIPVLLPCFACGKLYQKDLTCSDPFVFARLCV